MNINPENTALNEAANDPARVLLRAPTLFDGKRPKSGVKRKPSIDRSALEWQCIQITASGETKTPVGQCIYCGKMASWTSSRIKDHIMGLNHSKACTATTDEFIEMKERISGKITKASRDKSLTTAQDKVQAAATGVQQGQSTKQQLLRASFALLKRADIDQQVARFVYAENLSLRIVSSPHFADLVRVLRAAPENYKLPDRNRLSGDLLDTVCTQLRATDQPLRDAMLSAYGCTILCDGWDDIDRNHLVNLSALWHGQHVLLRGHHTTHFRAARGRTIHRQLHCGGDRQAFSADRERCTCGHGHVLGYEGCLEAGREGEAVGEHDLLCTACAQPPLEGHRFHPGGVRRDGQDGRRPAPFLGPLALAKDKAQGDCTREPWQATWLVPSQGNPLWRQGMLRAYPSASALPPLATYPPSM